jgi:hypothetical protein
MLQFEAELLCVEVDGTGYVSDLIPYSMKAHDKPLPRLDLFRNDR